jgi:hypothetical protein
MEKLSEDKIKLIRDLRSRGHILSEIKNIVPAGKATIFKYIKGVQVKEEFKETFSLKRFNSKNLSKIGWKNAKTMAKEILLPLRKQNSFAILAALYWGEGNKKELNLINSDPALIKVFVECLYSIGVKKEELKITLRIYGDSNISKVKEFWSNLLEIPPQQISNINVLKGKKEGKLKFGMCRVRVRKGGKYFKLIISMINLLKSHYNAAVVQWIEQDTPNV